MAWVVWGFSQFWESFFSGSFLQEGAERRPGRATEAPPCPQDTAPRPGGWHSCRLCWLLRRSGERHRAQRVQTRLSPTWHSPLRWGNKPQRHPWAWWRGTCSTGRCDPGLKSPPKPQQWCSAHQSLPWLPLPRSPSCRNPRGFREWNHHWAVPPYKTVTWSVHTGWIKWTTFCLKCWSAPAKTLPI